MEARGLALVTGASRGIGRAVAIALAEVGFEVIATMREPNAGRDLVGLASGFPGSIRLRTLDVTKPDNIDVPDGLKVLVNNAGVEAPYLPVEHQPVDDWRVALETNLFGTLEMTRRAVPAMKRAGGVIVNVTTTATLVPMAMFGAYRASKAAVSAMTDSLQLEVSQFGIRVVEVMPGPVATDMLAASARMPEGAAYDDYRELASQVQQMRASADPFTQPVAEAARRIVDAILDDNVRGRVGCDPLGSAIVKDGPEGAARFMAARKGL